MRSPLFFVHLDQITLQEKLARCYTLTEKMWVLLVADLYQCIDHYFKLKFTGQNRKFSLHNEQKKTMLLLYMPILTLFHIDQEKIKELITETVKNFTRFEMFGSPQDRETPTKDCIQGWLRLFISSDDQNQGFIVENIEKDVREILSFLLKNESDHSHTTNVIKIHKNKKKILLTDLLSFIKNGYPERVARVPITNISSYPDDYYRHKINEFFSSRVPLYTFSARSSNPHMAAFLYQLDVGHYEVISWLLCIQDKKKYVDDENNLDNAVLHVIKFVKNSQNVKYTLPYFLYVLPELFSSLCDPVQRTTFELCVESLSNQDMMIRFAALTALTTLMSVVPKKWLEILFKIKEPLLNKKP